MKALKAQLVVGVGLIGAAGMMFGQQDGGDATDLAKKTQNPVADLISVPFQNNFFFSEDDGDLFWQMNVQPVVPFNLNEDWKVITRTILPVLGLESAPPGVNTFGIGDLNSTFFFSPRKDSDLTWGVGPILTIPTASQSAFGTGKWSAGPSAVALKMAGPWVVGALVNNQWSFAGWGDENVNFFLLQPFINYNFEGGVYASFAPIITADWTADSGERWTVPLGGGFGKVFNIGKQPINTSLQAYYNVERPTGGPEWSLRFQVQFLFPK